MLFLSIVLAYHATGVEVNDFCPDALNGGILGAENTTPSKTHLVVSHCGHDLYWLTRYFNMSTLETITIISKCGIVPTPTYGAQTINLPNRGRCDHSYAWWMVHMASEDTRIRDDDIVFFVKDTHNVPLRNSGIALADITLRVAKSNGFACAERPNLRMHEQLHGENFCRKRYWSDSMTSFAYAAGIDTYSMDGYSHGKVGGVKYKDTSFKSGYKNLGEWRRSMGMEWTSIVPICYGGMFAAKVMNIKAQLPISLILILRSLSRADNLEEGHFMERSWAALLQTPLSEKNITTLKKHETMVAKEPWKAGVIYADCASRRKNILDDTCVGNWVQHRVYKLIFTGVFLLAMVSGFREFKQMCVATKKHQPFQRCFVCDAQIV